VRLSDFDLAQLDEQTVTGLPGTQKDVLLVKLLSDLKEARDRLKADSRTSSRPPSSDNPWSGSPSDTPEEASAPETQSETESSPGEKLSAQSPVRR